MVSSTIYAIKIHGIYSTEPTSRQSTLMIGTPTYYKKRKRKSTNFVKWNNPFRFFRFPKFQKHHFCDAHRNQNPYLQYLRQRYLHFQALSSRKPKFRNTSYNDSLISIYHVLSTGIRRDFPFSNFLETLPLACLNKILVHNNLITTRDFTLNFKRM